MFACAGLDKLPVPQPCSGDYSEGSEIYPLVGCCCATYGPQTDFYKFRCEDGEWVEVQCWKILSSFSKIDMDTYIWILRYIGPERQQVQVPAVLPLRDDRLILQEKDVLKKLFPCYQLCEINPLERILDVLVNFDPIIPCAGVGGILLHFIFEEESLESLKELGN